MKLKLIPMLLLASCAGLHAQVVADLAADFSTAANPNGGWLYGYSSTQNGTGTKHPFTLSWSGVTLLTPAMDGSQYTPYIFRNGTGSTVSFTPTTGGLDIPIAAGSLVMSPGPTGPSEYSFADWTVTLGGLYSISASFLNADTTNGGATVNAAVLRNGSVLGSGTVNSSTSFLYNPGALSLAGGDVIRFVVGNGGGSYFHDLTRVSATVTAVPEPATWAAWAGLGAAALAAWRRRARRAIS